MLERKVYSVFDSKVGVYGMPFFAVNDADATRDFCAAAMDRSTKIGLFPGDFTLFGIGVFNTVSGKMSEYDAHENLGTALQIMSQLELSSQVGSTISDIRNAFSLENK